MKNFYQHSSLVPLLSLLLTGCGMNDVDSVNLRTQIDSQLQPIVREFERDCQVAVRVPSITFAEANDLENPTRIGYCDWDGSIVLDLSMQDEPEHTLRVLLYHELGHCVLGKGHVEQPWQLMSAQQAVRYPDLYWARWPSLVEGLGGKCEYRGSEVFNEPSIQETSDEAN
jgi:hypothetical protein